MKQDSNAQHVKQRVKNGAFFKDGKEWFYNKYVSSYKMRFDLMILLIAVAGIIITFVFTSMYSVLSVSAKNGVIYLEGDFEDEFFIQKIPKHYRNNEKNILRFVVESYTNFFESYDINKFNIYKLNDQIKTIREKSNKHVGDKFEEIARNNYTNEIFAGITRRSKILSIEFVENDSIKKDFLDIIMPEKTPNKVKIELLSTIFKGDDRALLKEEHRIIEVTFDYKPIEKNKKGNFEDLGFRVIEYNYL